MRKVFLNVVDITTDLVRRNVPGSAHSGSDLRSGVPLELVLGVGSYAPERLHRRAERDVHVHGVDEEHDHDEAEHHQP